MQYSFVYQAINILMWREELEEYKNTKIAMVFQI